jgi:hypothetical protein
MVVGLWGGEIARWAEEVPFGLVGAGTGLDLRECQCQCRVVGGWLEEE